MGLAYVLTMLKRAGYSFDLIDMDINKLTVDDVKNMLVGKTYDVVALGCIVTGLAQVKKLAEIAREKSPHCTIIAGNSVATSIPELLLTNTEVDIAVMGEGDVTIVELMDALRHARNWKNIPGIAYLEKEQLVLSPKRKVIPTLDSIGFPDWTLFEIEKYNTGQMDRMNAGAEKQIAFPLNAARGCPFNCTFCYHCFKGEKYRKYSEEAVFAEFIRLHDQFGANRIMLWDELTFPNIRTVERMADQLEKLPFSVSWEGVSRSGLFDPKHAQLVQRLKKSGCTTIAFSLENADPEILRAMNKKITHDKTRNHAHTLWNGGITPATSVIFGYPQETERSIRDTIKLCDECNIYPSVGFLLPLPGTPIWEWALETGKIKDPVEFLMKAGDRQDMHINLTNIPTEEFLDMVSTQLSELAKKCGLYLENPLKTGTYRSPVRKMHFDDTDNTPKV